MDKAASGKLVEQDEAQILVPSCFSDFPWLNLEVRRSFPWLQGVILSACRSGG